MNIDYLIIGQGIAGTMLSHQLLKRGKKVLVIDEPQHNKSSRVAAGLFNPITGRRMIKTWQANHLFPFLENYYQRLENELGTSFFFKKNIYRPFLKIEEQNEWSTLNERPPYAYFIEKCHTHSQYGNYINDPHGGLELTHAGYIDTIKLLDAYQNYISDDGILIKEHFDESLLEINQDHITYNNINTKKIIYCGGPQTAKSTFFHQLPLKLVKGEIITIESDLPQDIIFNRGIFVIPIGNNLFRVGSTYEWDYENEDPSEAGKEELCEKLDVFIKTKYKVRDHHSGIRPTTNDRRPFVGFHPRHKNIGIFNGMGTKGISLSPFFAHHFAEHLEVGTNLMNEVNISRHYSLMD